MAALCVVSRIHGNDIDLWCPVPGFQGCLEGFHQCLGSGMLRGGGSQPRKTIFKKSPEAGFKMIKREFHSL